MNEAKNVIQASNIIFRMVKVEVPTDFREGLIRCEPPSLLRSRDVPMFLVPFTNERDSQPPPQKQFISTG